MSETMPDEQKIKEATQELVDCSIASLKKIFPMPPASKTWEEIEEGFSKGKSLQEICGISEQTMQEKYETAKEKLSMGDYIESKEMFADLCLCNQQVPKYWGGLAKSCEGLKLYKEAIDSYKMVAFVTGANEPLPFLCMGYCYLCLDDKKNALEVFEQGREIADTTNSQHREILQQIDEFMVICKK